MAGRKLPVLGPSDEIISSLAADGHRRFVYPADVKGRFTKLRRVVFAALVAIWIALPLVNMGGHPAMFLDVQARRFYLFGATFNAQDVWLVFFVITGGAFALAFMTSLLGRVWCGYACPQTVFLEGLFRPIERLVEGSREKRMRRDKGPMTAEKFARKAVKHLLYLVAAFAVAHIAVSFFVSVPALFAMMRGSPTDHPEAFLWAGAMTLLLYGNFAWFREQFCLIVCPYGRMQSILFDEDSLIIGYDEKRGEPRGKLGVEGSGDCIDCRRCVVVCPTGIDIRNGLQLDCVACAACVDACDEIMVKVGKPKGLVRYDSQRGLAGGKTRLWRGRLLVYGVFGIFGLGAATAAALSRTDFEATIIRETGAPFVVEGDQVRNAFSLHLVNKDTSPADLEISPVDANGLEFLFESDALQIAPLSDRTLRVMVLSKGAKAGDQVFRLKVRRTGNGGEKVLTGRFVGPGAAQ